MEHLLRSAIRQHFGVIGKPVIWDSEEFNEDWLKKVWLFIKRESPRSLSQFEDLQIIPVKCCKEVKLQTGDSYDKSFLYPLKSRLILKKSYDRALPEAVEECLKALSNVVLRDMPDYILSHQDIFNYIYRPTPKQVIRLLNKTPPCEQDQLVAAFHERTVVFQRELFVSYLEKPEQLSGNARALMCRLKLFRSNNEEQDPIEVMCCEKILVYNGFPVQFPKTVLLCDRPENSRQLQEILGATIINRTDAMQYMLQQCVSETFYSHEQQDKLMQHFFDNMRMYTSTNILPELARKVKFVPTKSGKRKCPAEVYDPFDQTLQDFFNDDDLFPTQNFAEGIREQLIELGMKTMGQCTFSDILEVARHLHHCALKSNRNDHQEVQKQKRQSDALFIVLERTKTLIRNESAAEIGNLRIVFPACRPDHYPRSLPWYTDPEPDSNESDLVSPSKTYHWSSRHVLGSVAPVYKSDISEKLSDTISQGNSPTSDLILKQLYRVASNYHEEFRVELLPIISNIFHYLSKNFCGIDMRSEFEKKDLMWNGNGFSCAQMMYCSTSSTDINLEPYVYSLPPELRSEEIQQFCQQIGCHQTQDQRLFLAVQEIMKEKYEKGNAFGEGEIHRDMDIVINILNRLKLDTHIDKEVKIYFPVYSTGKQKLVLRLAKDCHFCNSDWLKDIATEEGEQFYFVHENVPLDTAERLGVPSLTDDLLIETEGIEGWGQQEPLTRRLRNLLKEYKDGFSVP